MQSLTFARYFKDELFQFAQQLLVRDASRAPSVHAEVALRVKVTIGEQACLTPIVKSLSFFVVEECHDAALVVHVSLLAYERGLHLVDGLLEELFVLSDQQLLDALQSAFSLSDRVDLDALYKYLNQRS